MTKVLGIQEKNFFKLVERMNKFNENNNVIATQVFPLFNNTDSEGSLYDEWYALVYYDSQEKETFKGVSPERRQEAVGSSSGNRIRETPDIPASPAQMKLLTKLGYKGKLNLTKKEAWLETKKLKEK